MPQYGIPEDIQALQIYQNAMPGYNVIGFIHDIGNPWYSEDALHCRTMGVFNPNMMHISHKSIRLEELINNGAIYIEAEVVDYNDFNTNLQSVVAHWKYSAEDGPFGEFPLEFQSDNVYIGTFPLLNSNSTIEYFITATSISGNTVSHPNAGWHIFDSTNTILGDINEDEMVNVIDVIMVVNMILGELPIQDSADLNQDGSVNVIDIIELVNIIILN